jgi:hypothetical protein
VPGDTIILEELRALRGLVIGLAKSDPAQAEPRVRANMLCLRKVDEETVNRVITELAGVTSGSINSSSRPGNGHQHLAFLNPTVTERRRLLELTKKHVPEARWISVPAE